MIVPDGVFNILMLVNRTDEADRIAQLLREIGCGLTIRTGLPSGSAVTATQDVNYDVLIVAQALIARAHVDGMCELRDSFGDIPVIVLAREQDEEQAISTVREGVQDYIIAETVEEKSVVRTLRSAVDRHHAARRRHIRLHSQERPARRTPLRQLHPGEDRTRTLMENVSHEWRTPLAVISEYSSLLSDGAAGDITDDQRQMLLTIQDRSGDLSHMVNDLLIASQIDQGTLSLNRRVCEVSEIVRQVRSTLDTKAERKAVELLWEMPAKMPVVYCDAEKASHTLANFLSNAIKYSPASESIVVTIGQTSDGADVQFEIQDNGPGIEDHRQHAIFQKLRQVNREARTSRNGLGLGLHVAYELTTRQFGQVFLDSRPGRGSAFSFSLPVHDPVRIFGRYLQSLSTCETPPNSLFVYSFEHANAEGNSVDYGSTWCDLQRDDGLVLQVSSRIGLCITTKDYRPEMSDSVPQLPASQPDDSAVRNTPSPDASLIYEATWRHPIDPNISKKFISNFIAVAEICQSSCTRVLPEVNRGTNTLADRSQQRA